MSTPLKIYTPTGKLIVGTSESMLTMHGIDCTGRNANGSIAFDYNDTVKEYWETEEQRTDARGERLFQDEDGTDWPESSLSLEGEPLKPMPKPITDTPVVAALRRLRNCPDLNLDELEPETIAAIDHADEVLAELEGA